MEQTAEKTKAVITWQTLEKRFLKQKRLGLKPEDFSSENHLCAGKLLAAAKSAAVTPVSPEVLPPII
ncbi:MAG: hypothetical protein ACI4UV_05090 [Victivallales bacterium]